MSSSSRRTFLRRAGAAAVPLALGAGFNRLLAQQEEMLDVAAQPDAWARLGTDLRGRFASLKRHFIFEYYPWYGTDPWFHWDQWNRVPPQDIAATSVPLLGPYDSRNLAVLEQHARWIAESGAGAISLSWWGSDSYSGQNAHRVMDVMADHDIKVMFHIEPYPGRNERYVEDVGKLIREYGDQRSWDAMLLLENADGSVGPVFKSFRTIVSEESTDCHGVTTLNDGYTPDEVWRQRTDSVRTEFRTAFDHVTLLADSLSVRRVERARFDGCAPYSNFREPEDYGRHARRATDHDLLFAFNCNPGFDGIARRNVPEGSCYQPPPFHPGPVELDWTLASDRERARRLAQRRIRRTLKDSVAVQMDPAYSNYQRGFLLVFLNSFNEWHEGHAFEPARRYRHLSAAERAVGYHNPRNGFARYRTLRRALRGLLNA